MNIIKCSIHDIIGILNSYGITEGHVHLEENDTLKVETDQKIPIECKNILRSLAPACVSFIWPDQDLPDMDDVIEFVKELQKEREENVKCECGSEKCGSSIHSTWCPKYRKD